MNFTTNWPRPKLLCFVVFAAALGRAPAQGITFGTPSAFTVAATYSESGYTITTYRMEIGPDYDRVPALPLQGGFSTVQANQSDPSAAFVLTKTDSSLFGLQSVDLRSPNELSDGSATGSVTFDAYLYGGGHLYQTFTYTQGWATYTFPVTFNNVTKVVVDQGYFAIDNINFTSTQAVPEPAISCLVLGLSALPLLYWRKSSKPTVPI